MKPAGGNRCGHNPRAWRTTLNRPERHDLPLVLRIFAAEFTRSLREHPERWPELAQAQQRLPGIGGDRRVNSHRRSECRETIALVVHASALRMEIPTRDTMNYRVGWGRRGSRDFQGLPRATVAAWTGRHESSVARAHELVRYAGIMSGPGRKGPNIIKQPVERCDDSHEHVAHCPGRIERTREDGVTVRGCHGLPAMRRIARWVFERLGLGGLLDAAIERARAKEAGELAPPPPDELAGRRPPNASAIVVAHALAAKKAIGPPDDG